VAYLLGRTEHGLQASEACRGRVRRPWALAAEPRAQLGHVLDARLGGVDRRPGERLGQVGDFGVLGVRRRPGGLRRRQRLNRLGDVHQQEVHLLLDLLFLRSGRESLRLVGLQTKKKKKKTSRKPTKDTQLLRSSIRYCPVLVALEGSALWGNTLATALLHDQNWTIPFGRGAFDSAKNHERQRRNRQSVTAKREKSQRPKFV